MRAKIIRYEQVKPGQTILRDGRMVKVEGVNHSHPGGDLVLTFKSGPERYARVSAEHLVAVRESFLSPVR